MLSESYCLMHQPDAVWLFHTTQAFTYRAQSPLAFRGQAKTRNIKARVEEGKIGAKRGREGGQEGRKERCRAPSPYVSPSLCLWSEAGAQADKLGSRQLHSMVNILSLSLPPPTPLLLPEKERQGECVNCSQGHGITYPQGAASQQLETTAKTTRPTK